MSKDIETLMDEKSQEVTCWLIEQMQQHPERMEEIQARAAEAMEALNNLTEQDPQKVIDILTKLKGSQHGRIITDTFTYDDIYRTIRQDQCFLLHQLREHSKHYDKVIKKIKPKGSFMLKPIEVKGNRGLNYIIVFSNPSFDDYKKAGALYDLYTIYLQSDGFKVFYAVKDMDNKTLDTLQNQHYLIFNPHFFNRYKERFLQQVDIPKKDVIISYIKNNPQYIINDQNNPKYPNGIYLFCNNGLALGIRLENGNIELKTFVSEEMLKGMQTELADDAKAARERWLKATRY